MLRLHRQLPFIIATCLALRALVPVGYMLQAPAGTDLLGFELLLCPMQNPGLTLDALGAAPHGAHNHHAPLSPPVDGAGLVLDASSGCIDWLNSSVAVALTLPPALASGTARVYITNPPSVAVELRRRGIPQARAPPV